MKYNNLRSYNVYIKDYITITIDKNNYYNNIIK